jgi:hypothetical protein
VIRVGRDPERAREPTSERAHADPEAACHVGEGSGPPPRLGEELARARDNPPRAPV